MTQWQPQRNESACQTAPTGAVKPPSHPCFGKLLQGGQVPPRGCARPWGTHSHGAWAHLADACTLATGGYVQSLVGIRQRRAGSWAARQPALTPLPNKGVIRHPKLICCGSRGGTYLLAQVSVLLAPASKFPGPCTGTSSGWQLTPPFTIQPHTCLGKYCLQVYLLPGASHSQDTSKQCLESYQNSLCRKLL